MQNDSAIKLRREPLIALAMTIATAIFLCFFEVSYQTNDDIVFWFLMKGFVFSEQPTGYLGFINVILGSGLAFLYERLPQVEWYRLLILLIHLVTIYLSALVMLPKKDKRGVLSFFIYIAAFEFFFWRNINFTITAFLPVQIGLLTLAHILHERKVPSRGLLVACLALVLLGSLVRWDSAKLAIVLATPLFLGIAVFHRIDLKRCLLLTTLLFAAIVAPKIVHDAIYATHPKLREFSKNADAFFQLHDLQRAQYTTETKNSFDRVGWSRNDFDMIMVRFYADKSVFNAEKAKQLLVGVSNPKPGSSDQASLPSNVQQAPAVASSSSASPPPAAIASSSIHTKIFEKSELILMLLAVLYASMQMGFSNRLTWVYLVVSGNAMAVCIYLQVFQKLPPRVLYPVISFVFLSGIVLKDSLPLKTETTRGFRWANHLVVALFAMLFLMIELPKAARENEELKKLSTNLAAAVDDLNPSSKDLYVVFAFPWELVDPKEDPDFLKNMRVVGAGWGIFMPSHDRMLEQFDIEDIFIALCRRKDVFLIGDEHHVRLLKTYMKEHYSIGIDASKVFERNLGRNQVAGSGYKGRNHIIKVYHLHELVSVGN